MSDSQEPANIHILGGGPAGLIAGYLAKKRSLTLNIYEASGEIGGNCKTLKLGEFYFDTGAHRLHDKIPWVTGEFRKLLGKDLLSVSAPSSIVYYGRFLNFPLTPFNLIKGLDFRTLIKAAIDVCTASRFRWGRNDNFKIFALSRYGKTLAELFLLNYSQKLWGRDASRLSVEVAGDRLSGLNLCSFFARRIFKKPGHLDGRFYYPRKGIGHLFNNMADEIGYSDIFRDSPVTKIIHSDGLIRKIITSGTDEVLGHSEDGRDFKVNSVINTLPLPTFLKLLDPSPPKEILEIAHSITFRNLVLGVLSLDKESFSSYASLYFPNEDTPFTRLYEPKNRSCLLAPKGKTCVVLEVPCFSNDKIWTMAEIDIKHLFLSHLQKIQIIKEVDIIDFKVYRMSHAYPVLETEVTEKVSVLLKYCSGFRNLRMLGRNAMFRYSHIHDLFKAGKETIDEFCKGE